ncbi:MAG: FMN-binding protein, partial [Firmicutes bacterium]|nr:FMN-binding protein [Bacillota bacterium]
GTYTGAYSAFPVSAEVAVTVQDHQIAAIDLVRHNNGQGGAAEAIPQMVVDAQSIQVDTVTGATFSSKVILLAIRDALQNAAGE